VYPSIEAAQEAVCLPLRTVEPQPASAAVYERLFAQYRAAYFALGTRNADPSALGSILPTLRSIAAEAARIPSTETL
jgi:L-ribulokinase